MQKVAEAGLGKLCLFVDKAPWNTDSRSDIIKNRNNKKPDFPVNITKKYFHLNQLHLRFLTSAKSYQGSRGEIIENPLPPNCVQNAYTLFLHPLLCEYYPSTTLVIFVSNSCICVKLVPVSCCILTTYNYPF
jgi:hypothetical protein